MKVASESVTMVGLGTGSLLLGESFPCCFCRLHNGVMLQSQRLGLPGRLVVLSTVWNVPALPCFLICLPGPPSSPSRFLLRWPPHWGGGHPGAGHGEPHHLRRDRPALGCLRLCGQQARHPGEENRSGPAGGTRYGPPTPSRGREEPPTQPPPPAPFLASSTSLTKPRVLCSPSFLSPPESCPLPLPRPSGQARGGSSLLSPRCWCVGNGRTFLVIQPVSVPPGATATPSPPPELFPLSNLSWFPCLCHSHVSLPPRAVFIHTSGTAVLTPACALSVCLSFLMLTPQLPPHMQSWPPLPWCAGPLPLSRSFCPSFCPGLNCPDALGLVSHSQGFLWLFPPGVGERGIRNLNAVCLAFHVPLICPNESDGAFHFLGVMES